SYSQIRSISGEREAARHLLRQDEVLLVEDAVRPLAPQAQRAHYRSPCDKRHNQQAADLVLVQVRPVHRRRPQAQERRRDDGKDDRLSGLEAARAEGAGHSSWIVARQPTQPGLCPAAWVCNRRRASWSRAL